jgi:hypothetical protein
MKAPRRIKPIVALGAALSALRPPMAAAEPGSLDFGWSAPANCPDAARVRAEIESILHGPVRLGEGERLVVRAKVRASPDADQWRVDIETEDGERTRQRSVDGATCDDVAEATALFVAVLIDARAAPARPDSADEKTATPSETPSPIHRDATRADERRTSSFPLSPAAGITVGVAGGYLPHWSPGVRLYGVLGWRSIRAKIAGQALLPARRTVGGAASQGADFQLFSGGLDVCIDAPVASLRLGPCVGTDVAFMQGKGFGPGVTERNGTATFAGIAVGGSLRWIGPGRLSLPLELEAIVPLARPEFVFSGPAGTSVHRPGSAAGRVTLGVEFRL